MTTTTACHTCNRPVSFADTHCWYQTENSQGETIDVPICSSECWPETEEALTIESATEYAVSEFGFSYRQAQDEIAHLESEIEEGMSWDELHQALDEI